MIALVVDDDAVLADLVSFTLRREGFQVVVAHDGVAALQRWQADQPDIVILDVNLPRTVPPTDGFTICRHIREKSTVPIIMLTVREDEEDIVYGLQAGADDYITKPFSPRQLVARVQAVLRRANKPMTPAQYQVDDLRLDSERRTVQLGDGDPVSLTALETRLLETLIIHAGQILSIQQIITHVWGAGGGHLGGERDMLRQLVRRLRAKIEQDPAQPERIETVPGVGYGLKKN